MDAVEKIISDIIEREGGDKFTNDPTDRGGATKFGITAKALAKWRGLPSVTADDVANMQRYEAEDIYRAEYVRPFVFAEGEPAIFAHLVDCGVNHGVGGAIKLLQRAIGVTADGAFGAKSMAAYRSADKSKLHGQLIAQRAMHYARIVKSDPAQSRFIEGWMRRCMEFLVGKVF